LNKCKIILAILVAGCFLHLTSFVYAQETKDTANAEVKPETVAPEEEAPKFVFSMAPSLGFTYFNSSKAEQESEHVQWLAKLQARSSYEGSFLQFYASFLAQYGQIHLYKKIPEKFMDDVILTLTPSITIFPSPQIRLFLETSAETDLGDGMIGERKTSFLDPLFLYQTLFVGQKQFIMKTTPTSNFSITYGVGYAFQQTFNKDLKKDTLTGTSSNIFESGYSAVFQIDVAADLAKNLKFKTNFKSMALSKKDFFKDMSSSRGTIMLSSGLFYSVIGVEYSLYVIYDKNISTMRQLEQSLLLTFSFDM